MLKSFHLGIALKYIFSRRKEKYISIISVLSTGGVALSVMVLIVVLAVMSGFERDMKKKITGLNAHLTVQNDTGILYGWRPLQDKLKKLKSVKGVSPYVLGQVMIKKSGRLYGAGIKGIDLEFDRNVTEIADYIKNPLALNEPKTLVPGKELLKKLNVQPGEKITLLAPTDIMTALGPAPRVIKCNVGSSFDSGMYQYDAAFLLCNLELGQRIFSLGQGVHGLELSCKDADHAFAVKREILSMLPDENITVQTWMEKNRNLFAAVKTEKKVMFILLMLAVLVSASNIISTLVMLVMEKTKDIGILKSFGISSGGILKMFFLVGTVIGVIGTAIGTCAGLLFLRYIDVVSNAVTWFTGFEVFPKEIYYLDAIPVCINPHEVATIALSSLGVCLASSLYPAWKASRLNIVEALRYE